jgi:hypothetical protein
MKARNTEEETRMSKVIEKLPEKCYGILLATNELIIIRRGEDGYYPMKDGPYYTDKETVSEMNAKIGVTPAQAEAMSMGSMFGWNTPGADPDNYDEDGKWKNR